MSEKTVSVQGTRPNSAFDSWHFDALSDDGREALLVTFNDNYPFSPRYFREAKHASTPDAPEIRFPTVTFAYSVDGKSIIRSVNEFRPSEFSAAPDGSGCSIGPSSFKLNSAAYGSGFVLNLELLTPRRCRVEAQIEWVSIESGVVDGSARSETGSSSLNIVAPRSDVSGKIVRIGRRGRSRTVFQFRGTGYHDHFHSDRPLESAVSSRWWGRAHFVDSTVIFRADQLPGESLVASKLFLVRDGAIHEREVTTEAKNVIRDRYGLTIPGRFTFLSEDNIRLRVKPLQAIESGFFKKSMVSEMTLMLRDGKPRKTLGITEFVAPGRLKNVLFRWFTDLRIGKNGRWPWF